MKKIISLVLVFMMTMLLLPASASSATTRYGFDSWGPSVSDASVKVTDLYAGQSINVGDVLIDYKGTNSDGKEQYLVTYKITEPSWYISQIHFEGISDDIELALIANKGGIVPGRLSMSQTFNLPAVDPATEVISGGTQTFSILYTSSEKVTSFAAHAVVYQANTTATETAWGKGSKVPGNNWSMYFTKGELLQYLLVDTVEVPSTDVNGISSNIILENGWEYRLDATGTFTYNSAGDWADAEYYRRNGAIVKDEGSKQYVLDVCVGGMTLTNDWGAYNEDHAYTMNYTGTGSQLHFHIYDSYAGDNNGVIEVKIFKKLW